MSIRSAHYIFNLVCLHFTVCFIHIMVNRWTAFEAATASLFTRVCSLVSWYSGNSVLVQEAPGVYLRN